MKTTPLGYSLASPSTDSPRPPRGCGGKAAPGWRGGVNDTPNEVVRHKSFTCYVYMECQ